MTGSQRKSVKVIADKSLDVARFLDNTGGVRYQLEEIDGRSITADSLEDASALLVRSVTRVDEGLLCNSSVEFVGSATIGFDHVDCAWLDTHAIEFVHSPGCNANAVVDYVMAVLLDYSGEDNLRNRSVGVVGYGNVGKRLVSCLRFFGIRVKVYDPLVSVPDSIAVPLLADALQSDIVSIHVPLSRDGEHATFHMMSEKELSLMHDNSLLINTSRGEVIDEPALKQHLRANNRFAIALDVWEGEPDIDGELLQLATYATGHIAGYSRLGKLRGSEYVISAMQDHFKAGIPGAASVSATVGQSNIRPESKLPLLNEFISLSSYATELRKIFDPVRETQAFTSLFDPGDSQHIDQSQRSKRFDSYRQSYCLREEIQYE